jgi:hypothetical protein
MYSPATKSNKIDQLEGEVNLCLALVINPTILPQNEREKEKQPKNI